MRSNRAGRAMDSKTWATFAVAFFFRTEFVRKFICQFEVAIRSRSTFQRTEEGLLTGRDQRLVATADTLRSSRTPCVFIPNASRPVVHVGGALNALNFLPRSASYIFLRSSSEIACRQNPACGSARAYGASRGPIAVAMFGSVYSAPTYDEVTKPVYVPYPAACVVFRDECRCYS